MCGYSTTRRRPASGKARFASAVHVLQPVRRDPAGRAGARLLGRTRPGRRELRPVEQVPGAVVEEPVLPRLEALDDVVPGRAGVRGRVLGRGGVAAADVATLGAAPQVDPPPGGHGRLAVHAARAAGRHVPRDAVGHVVSPICGPASGSRTTKVVLPGRETALRWPRCLLTTMRQ